MGYLVQEKFTSGEHYAGLKRCSRIRCSACLERFTKATAHACLENFTRQLPYQGSLFTN